MKKEINLVVGDRAISAFGAQCVNICGHPEKLKSLAVNVCPEFHLCNVCVEVVELWFYRGILIFKDFEMNVPFCVPLFRGRVCRFFSLKSAKSAISRYMNKKGGAK
jgi:hypothetical protein